MLWLPLTPDTRSRSHLRAMSPRLHIVQMLAYTPLELEAVMMAPTLMLSGKSAAIMMPNVTSGKRMNWHTMPSTSLMGRFNWGIICAHSHMTFTGLHVYTTVTSLAYHNMRLNTAVTSVVNHNMTLTSCFLRPQLTQNITPIRRTWVRTMWKSYKFGFVWKVLVALTASVVVCTTGLLVVGVFIVTDGGQGRWIVVLLPGVRWYPAGGCYTQWQEQHSTAFILLIWHTSDIYI